MVGVGGGRQRQEQRQHARTTTKNKNDDKRRPTQNTVSGPETLSLECRTYVVNNKVLYSKNQYSVRPRSWRRKVERNSVQYVRYIQLERTENA
mmetsp:Transcript_46078/g.51533  ORF Transcript_46078/g.51533 Transcript_46078/m.51533 type:complete len:93 (+) Transcript_46078:1458-1736(+)